MYIHVLSTRVTSFPVRPPTLPNDFDNPFVAAAIAGPADEATFERPCCAFAAYSEATLDAFAAESLAVSVAFCVVVDSNLRAAMRLQAPDCRSIGRARPDDIVTRAGSGEGGKEKDKKKNKQIQRIPRSTEGENERRRGRKSHKGRRRV